MSDWKFFHSQTSAELNYAAVTFKPRNKITPEVWKRRRDCYLFSQGIDPGSTWNCHCKWKFCYIINKLMCISVVGCCTGASNFKICFLLNILARVVFFSASSFLQLWLSYFSLRADTCDWSLIKRNQLKKKKDDCLMTVSTSVVSTIKISEWL